MWLQLLLLWLLRLLKWLLLLLQSLQMLRMWLLMLLMWMLMLMQGLQLLLRWLLLLLHLQQVPAQPRLLHLVERLQLLWCQILRLRRCDWCRTLVWCLCCSRSCD